MSRPLRPPAEGLRFPDGLTRELLRPRTAAFGAALTLLVAENALSVAASLLSVPLFDRGLLRGDFPLAAKVLPLQAGLLVAAGLLGALAQWRCLRLGWELSHELAQRAYRNAQRQSLRFFIDTGASELMQRLRTDVDAVQMGVSSLANALVAALKLLLAATAMFWWDWRLAAAAAVTLPASAWLSRRAVRLTQAHASQQVGANEALSAQMYQTLSVGGYLLTATCGSQTSEAGRFARLRETLWGLSARRHAQRAVLDQGSLIVGQAGHLSLQLSGAYLISRGSLTLGELAAFGVLSSYLRSPMAHLAAAAPAWSEMAVSLRRVLAVLTAVPEIVDPPQPRAVGPTAGLIELRGVRFAYLPGRPVLDGLDLRAAPGEMTALVGPTGAGKTTTAYVMMRFLEPQAGEALLDGVPLAGHSLGQLRQSFGFMTQDSNFFSATLRENLLMARRDADDAMLEAACRRAQIWGRIQELPKGLDTHVGEAGYRFSGGERQRLSLARVFLKDARILILDEPTAALDNATERRIIATLRDLAQEGRTVVIITHKREVMDLADRVVSLGPESVPAGGAA